MARMLRRASGCRTPARQRGISLRSETPASVTVLADELKLRQVLQNLLTNAYDHAKGITTLVARVQPLMIACFSAWPSTATLLPMTTL